MPGRIEQECDHDERLDMQRIAQRDIQCDGEYAQALRRRLVDRSGCRGQPVASAGAYQAVHSISRASWREEIALLRPSPGGQRVSAFAYRGSHCQSSAPC
jgi:hypothetical protein